MADERNDDPAATPASEIVPKIEKQVERELPEAFRELPEPLAGDEDLERAKRSRGLLRER